MITLTAIVYLLCAFTCMICTALLWRAHRKSKDRLLFWSFTCFAGLSISNGLVFVDLILLKDGMDLAPFRSSITLISVSALLYGMVMETK